MLMINCSKLSGQLLWIWPALRDGGTPLPCCTNRLCHDVQRRLADGNGLQWLGPHIMHVHDALTTKQERSFELKSR